MNKYIKYSLVFLEVILLLSLTVCLLRFNSPSPDEEADGSGITDNSSEEGSKDDNNSVENSGSEEDINVNDSFTLGLWNIGHYSGGGLPNSTINSSNYETKLTAYKDFIYREVGADVFAVVEYSSVFGTSSSGQKLGRDVLYKAYSEKYEFAQSNYSCNALFSARSLFNVEFNEFECNKDATITHTTAIKASDYYYISADLNVGGETVKLIVCHLAFDKNLNPDTVNQNQVYELIEKYQGYKNVIMIGDWNCTDFNTFDIFTESGYELGNSNSSAVTCPSVNLSLDNVIYKGVEVSEFKIHKTSLSDHYAISCEVTLNTDTE